MAYLVGRPILRLRGHYLAVATLGMGLLIAMVFTNEARLTGGPDGMPVPRLELFGWRVRGSVTWYWVSGVTLVIGVWLATNLIGSPTGRAFRAIHDSETAASVLGIDLARYKLTAFVLSAVYAAVAGAYLALFDGLVTPATAGFLRSIEFVTMAVLGRARLDPRQRRGGGAARGAAAGAHRIPRIRAHRARPDHGRVHDLPARRHRAVARQLARAEAILSAFVSDSSCPALCRASTSFFSAHCKQDVDGRDYPSQSPLSVPIADSPAMTGGGKVVMSVLAVADVGIEFGGAHRARQVSFSVEPGEIFAVIGPNGAGKTTLFNIVSGLYRPRRGRVTARRRGRHRA